MDAQQGRELGHEQEDRTAQTAHQQSDRVDAARAAAKPRPTVEIVA